MTREEEQLLELGRKVFGMISDVYGLASTSGNAAYGNQQIDFPTGSVILFVVSSDELAAAFHAAADKIYEVRGIVKTQRDGSLN